MDLRYFDTIDEGISVNLLVHQAVYEYITDLHSPGTLWEARGIAGRKTGEYKQIVERIKDRLDEKMRSKEAQEKLQDYLRECKKLLGSLLNNQSVPEPYAGDRKFHFILGPTRTGGTYIQKEMSRATRFPLLNRMFHMLHDSIPHMVSIRGVDYDIGEENTNHWLQMSSHMNILFQFCQLLVYINREVEDGKDVVIKNSALCFCLPMADQLFGENARYVVTVRHPAATVSSRVEGLNLMENNEDTDEPLYALMQDARNQGRFDHLRKEFLAPFINDWEQFYRDLFRMGPPEGSVDAIRFGPEFDEFLNDVFEQQNFDDEPEGVIVRDRMYDRDFWNEDHIQQRFERLSRAWNIQGQDFPIPQKIR